MAGKVDGFADNQNFLAWCVLEVPSISLRFSMSEKEVPLSPAAQDAKEAMHHEFLRTMAQKMIASAIEEERARRIKELKELQNPSSNPEDADSVKVNAYEQLTVVQEDLVRSFNLMKVTKS